MHRERKAFRRRKLLWSIPGLRERTRYLMNRDTSRAQVALSRSTVLRLRLYASIPLVGLLSR
jgi:hypothetical protein